MALTGWLCSGIGTQPRAALDLTAALLLCSSGRAVCCGHEHSVRQLGGGGSPPCFPLTPQKELNGTCRGSGGCSGFLSLIPAATGEAWFPLGHLLFPLFAPSRGQASACVQDNYVCQPPRLALCQGSSVQPPACIPLPMPTRAH